MVTQLYELQLRLIFNMSSRTTIIDLSEVAATKHNKFFYEEMNSEVSLVPIHKANGDKLTIVASPIDFPHGRKVEGFLLAKGRTGIYRVGGEVDHTEIAAGERAENFVSLKIDLSKISYENKREYVRVVFVTPQYATIKKEEAIHRVEVVDFSAGGLRIRTKDIFTPGERFSMRFRPEISGEKYAFEFWGEIRSTLDVHSAGNLYGVRISPPFSSDDSELKKFSDMQRNVMRFVNEYLMFLSNIEE